MLKFNDDKWVAFYRAAFRYFRDRKWTTGSAIRQATAYANHKTK